MQATAHWLVVELGRSQASRSFSSLFVSLSPFRKSNRLCPLSNVSLGKWTSYLPRWATDNKSCYLVYPSIQRTSDPVAVGPRLPWPSRHLCRRVRSKEHAPPNLPNPNSCTGAGTRGRQRRWTRFSVSALHFDSPSARDPDS